MNNGTAGTLTLQTDGPLRVSVAIIWANLLSPRVLG
jgi:hypothetical protein